MSLPCSKAEAEALTADAESLALLDQTPVLMTSEADAARPDEWRMDAYFDEEPSSDTIARLRALIPSARRTRPAIERVPEQDWVTLSQAGLEPVQAGRFFVHTSSNADRIPAGAVAFRIDAGLAFGTGQHETTTGCLLTLDALKRRGARFRNILDLGTGTGLLAFAALKLWPQAYATASDIDPVSIDVTRDNAAANGVRLGDGRGALALAVAEGLDHRMLIAHAPYDLIVANILAQPLIDLAANVSAALEPGGTLVLAGLLDHQAGRVAAAYRRHGLRLAGRIERGDWPTLRMVKRRR